MEGPSTKDAATVAAMVQHPWCKDVVHQSLLVAAGVAETERLPPKRSASIVAGSCGCRGGRGCRRVRCRLCLLQCRIFRGEESHRQLWANINLLRAPIYANWTHRQREGTQRETQRDTANRAHGLEKVIPPSKARCSCGAPSTPPSTLAKRRRSVTGDKC